MCDASISKYVMKKKLKSSLCPQDLQKTQEAHSFVTCEWFNYNAEMVFH